MKTELTRRSFLKKTGLLAGLSLGLAKLGLAKKLFDMAHTSPILRTAPLGLHWETKDPFIFCAHHLDRYPGGNEKLAPKATLNGRNIGQDFANIDGWNMYHGTSVPGFPAHPHSGFETVTIVTQGMVDHSDSLGATGRFGNGDVQWLTAGKGIQHAEMFPLLNPDSNTLELFQLWLNLPNKNKKADPHYKMLWKEDIPIVTHTDADGKNSKITVVAGTALETQALSPTPHSWAADQDNDVQIWILKMDAGATFTIPTAKSAVHRTLYFYEGESCKISGETVSAKHMIELDHAQDTKITNGSSEGHFVFLQGKPINEPVIQYGPFVASSKAALEETINTYRRTEYGGWPWPSSDPTNGAIARRFSRLPNGEEVIR